VVNRFAFILFFILRCEGTVVDTFQRVFRPI